ncbi:hypothetical protein Aperf_G00000047043 [Anoplocephala perfoliata]
MVFRLGQHKRKEKQAENEGTKSKKSNNKLSARPPKVPGSALKSAEPRSSTAPPTADSVTSHTSNNHQNPQLAANGRNVLFRDNRLPDGTTMPRLSTQQPQIQPPGADRGSRISPTNSIYSSASAQPLFPSLASYPSTYTPKLQARHFDQAPRSRDRIYSDSDYNPSYGRALPKPDYPLSNDESGNSNRDSGLDTESRSSSGGNKYSQSRMNSFNSRMLGRSRGSYDFSELPQIVRPKNHQIDQEIPSFYQPAYATTSRSRRPINNHYYNYRSPAIPPRWIHHKEDLEEETYRPRSATSQHHCSSCSCFDDDLRTPRCTSALRRIQLDEGVHSERWDNEGQWDNISKSGKRERRFRREDEEEYSTKSMSRGLPRNQPVSGKYFEERDEVDRYGRLPPLRRPVGARPNSQDFFEGTDYANNEEEEDEEYGCSDEDASDYQEGSYFQSGARRYGTRGRSQSGFYRRRKGSSVTSQDTSVIRL